VSTSSPTLAILPFASAYRRWVPLVARTSMCFTSSGPTLTRAGSYPTSRCSDEVPCLGTWSRVGQPDCFRIETGRMAGAEHGNTVRARWHLRAGTNARWQRAGFGDHRRVADTHGYRER
jgi:hypothetical protein